MPGVAEFVALGAILFAMGLVGFLARRNLIIIFLSTEIMFQGVVLTSVGFSKMTGNLDGQFLGLFLLVIAAVEASLALGIVVLLYRRKGTLDSEVWSLMKG